MNDVVEYTDTTFKNPRASIKDSEDESSRLEKTLEQLTFELSRFKTANEKLDNLQKSLKEKDKNTTILNENLEKRLEKVTKEQED